MAAVLTVFAASSIGLGHATARADGARCSAVRVKLVLGEFVVEHTGAESAHTNATAPTSPEPPESAKPERQVQWWFINRQFLGWHIQW